MKAIFVITTLLLIVAIAVIVKQQKKINAQAETIEYQSNKLNRREQYQHKAKQFIFHTKKK
jgi:predicted Holliday junction resolvase-like endonuclease